MSSFEQPDAKRAKLEPPPSPPTQPLATPPPPTVSDRAAWGHEMDALKARHLASPQQSPVPPPPRWQLFRAQLQPQAAQLQSAHHRRALSLRAGPPMPPRAARVVRSGRRGDARGRDRDRGGGRDRATAEDAAEDNAVATTIDSGIAAAAAAVAAAIAIATAEDTAAAAVTLPARRDGAS